MSVTVPGDNAADYVPKGVTEIIEGTSTYVIGDKSSKKAIVVTPDVFGTGGDLLASQGFYVLLPDLLGDQALTAKDIPRFGELRERFFAEIGNPLVHLPLFTKLGESLKSDGFSVGSIGFCWGAKIAILAGATGLYSAVALVHPASMLTPEEAENCKTAIGVYQTKDESTEVLEPFIKKAADYKHYTETFHGFAAGRANLEDPVHKAAYEDVYGRLGAFFHKNL
ncbi:hypothetical protein FRC09_009342 [Ceratobasidium sp. 395]|nr:hypothetical protein FRC09_009342 [Ceratobasidium sp. 395]